MGFAGALSDMEQRLKTVVCKAPHLPTNRIYLVLRAGLLMLIGDSKQVLEAQRC